MLVLELQVPPFPQLATDRPYGMEAGDRTRQASIWGVRHDYLRQGHAVHGGDWS